jgi:hypothetical protein
MSFDDELLLTTLGGALEARPAQPSAEELDAFRALVVGAAGEILPFPESVGRGTAHHRGRTVLVAAALVVSLAVVGGAGALATGPTLPNVLRAPVRALGVDVDDTAVARIRSTMKELRSALGGTDDTRVQAAARALAAKLRTLSVADLAEVEAEARTLLQAADARQSPGLGRVDTGIAVPSPTAPVATPGAAPGPDDGVAPSSGSSGSGATAPGAVSPERTSPEVEGSESESPGSETRTPTATTEPAGGSERETPG